MFIYLSVVDASVPCRLRLRGWWRNLHCQEDSGDPWTCPSCVTRQGCRWVEDGVDWVETYPRASSQAYSEPQFFVWPIIFFLAIWCHTCDQLWCWWWRPGVLCTGVLWTASLATCYWTHPSYGKSWDSLSHLYSRRSASECNGVVSCAPVSQARPTYRHLQETVVPGHQWLDHAVPSRPHQQPPARGWFRLVTSYQRVWCGGRSLGPSCPGISLLIVNFISYFNKQMLLEILGIKNTMIIMATNRRPVAHQCENWDNNCIKSVWSSISSTRPTAAASVLVHYDHTNTSSYEHHYCKSSY